MKKFVFALTVAVTGLIGAGAASAQEYPPDTTVAQEPPVTTTTLAPVQDPPVPQLPATGSDVSDVLRIGALLATGGLVFVGLARRRAHNANSTAT